MRKHLTAVVLFVVLALLLTNPLFLHVWNAIEDKQDGLLNTWILAWVGHALVTDPLNLFNANIFYPYSNSLAYSEALLPPSLIALPITLASNNPIFGYNAALLAMLWLDAFGMYLFVYDLTRRTEAAWIAGVMYAFNPFILGNFAQIQLLTLGFLPLALLFLRKLLAGNSGSAAYKYAFLFGLFFILQALSSFYYALLAGFAVGVYLLWWLIRERNGLVRSLQSVVVPFAVSFVFIALAVTPFVLPYLQVQRELGFERKVTDSEPFSASLKQFTEVAPENFLYGKILAPNPVKRVGGYPLDNLFPGLIALGLALFGCITARSSVKYFLIGLLSVSLILALGPRLYLTSQDATDITLPYRWLYDTISIMRALRAPVRFDALINFAIAGLAGLGAAVLFERVPVKRSLLAAIAIVALMTFEYLSLPAAHITELAVANQIPDIYKWLAQQPKGVALELPMLGPNENNELDISTQYFTTYHWNQTPDGYSGFIPPRRGEIAYEMDDWTSPRALALLHALDVRYLIDHSPVKECYSGIGPIGFQPPVDSSGSRSPCVYLVPENGSKPPLLDKNLYLPSTVAAGAPFDAYLILINKDTSAYAVKPTDHANLQIHWSDGAQRSISVPLPLVTSSASVVPIPLHAPFNAGDYSVHIQSNDPLIGDVDLSATTRVGNESASEVVLPASVELFLPLPAEIRAGDNLPVSLLWLPRNKIDAYYSASVRLVNENGDKVANLDRQPILPTMLWRPDEPVMDKFEFRVPQDTLPGKYRVQVLVYQADTDQNALLLDENKEPQQTITLGEIMVK